MANVIGTNGVWQAVMDDWDGSSLKFILNHSIEFSIKGMTRQDLISLASLLLLVAEQRKGQY